MISVEQALQHVIEHSFAKGAHRVPLGDSLNHVLAEDVGSDVDSPPYDKSIVDGYAVRSTDFNRRADQEEPLEDIELQVVEEVTAGDVPNCRVETGRTVRVMTGAPIPEGADAVVMVEQTDWRQQSGSSLGVASFTTRDVVSRQNIMPRATSLRRGQVVLQSGVRLRPAEIGLLAEVGRSDVLVTRRPHVAVLPTGNELVDAGFVPGPGKIRNSNGPMLAACVKQAGARVVNLGIGRDEREQLRERIEQGLQADVLVVSGGVSAGSLDLVPEVLADLGVRQIFHKVNLKPGKPLWFGVADQASDSDRAAGRTLVFGLPGNPVSSFVCFQLFVSRAIQRLGGELDEAYGTAEGAWAELTRSFDLRGDRTTYHPARLEWSADGPRIDPVAWHGSGDARALVDANALAIFPSGPQRFEIGERIQYRSLK